MSTQPLPPPHILASSHRGLSGKAAMVYSGITVLLAVLACLVLKSWGPLALAGLFGLAIVAPLMLRVEQPLYFIWLLLFPLLYYDPLRLSSYLLGGSVVPLFVLITLPGAGLALITRWSTFRTLMVIALPQWCLLTGFALNLLHLDDVFRTDLYFRDFAELVAVLYLVTVAYRFIQQGARYRKLLYGLLMGLGLTNALMIIAEHYFHFGIAEAGGFMRPMGIFGFPTLASFICIQTLVLSLFGYFTAQNPRTRTICGIGIIILLMGILMSLTKTNISQSMLILAMWAFFLPKDLRVKAMTTAACLVVGLIAWEIFIDQGALWAQLTSRFSRTDTFEIRQMAWRIVLQHMDAQILGWGHGWMSATALLGQYNYNYVLFPVDVVSKAGPYAIHPHNAFIKYTYEMGLFGMGMLLAYIGIMLRGFWTAFTSVGSPLGKRLACLAIGNCVLGLLFSSLTGSPMADNYILLFVSTSLMLLANEAGWLGQEDKPVSP